MRIGILGGTFNPIHYGHLHSADEVRRTLRLDEIRFVPSASPPHKPKGEIASVADRLEMIRIALVDYPAYVCDSIEVERGGVSYTLDTVKEVGRRVPDDDEMFFIIGADAFVELGTWHRPKEVLSAINFAVTLRGEQNSQEYFKTLFRIIKEIAPGYCIKKDLSKEAQFIDEAKKRVIKFLPIKEIDISATRIRERIKKASSIRCLLPREVELFIIRRRLYGHSGIVS